MTIQNSIKKLLLSSWVLFVLIGNVLPMETSQLTDEQLEDYHKKAIDQITHAENHYQVLGLTKYANNDNIQTNYHYFQNYFQKLLQDIALSLKFSASELLEFIKKIKDAYENLKTPTKKATYDKTIEQEEQSKRELEEINKTQNKEILKKLDTQNTLNETLKETLNQKETEIQRLQELNDAKSQKETRETEIFEKQKKLLELQINKEEKEITEADTVAAKTELIRLQESVNAEKIKLGNLNKDVKKAETKLIELQADTIAAKIAKLEEEAAANRQANEIEEQRTYENLIKAIKADKKIKKADQKAREERIIKQITDASDLYAALNIKKTALKKEVDQAYMALRDSLAIFVTDSKKATEKLEELKRAYDDYKTRQMTQEKFKAQHGLEGDWKEVRKRYSPIKYQELMEECKKLPQE